MKIQKYLEALNTNKFFIGVMMILLNIGSRHLVDEFSGSQEEYSRNLLLRRIAIFAVCFIATRDIKVDAGISKADWPAYDRNLPPMFG
jgi:hypothetical protein